MSCKVIFDKDRMVWNFYYDRTSDRADKCKFYEELDRAGGDALLKFREQHPNEFRDLYRARWNKEYKGETSCSQPVKFENGYIFHNGQRLTYAQAYDVLENVGKLAEFRNECPQGFETLFRAKFNK